MKLIVGLGNPGRRYARHPAQCRVRRPRHHRGTAPAGVGVRARGGADGALAVEDVMLAKPLTFMNLSGGRHRAICFSSTRSTAAICWWSSTTSISSLARLRARPEGSAGGHNGLKSVIAQLGTEDFARLRIGVGRGDARRELSDHVLATFDADERPIVAETVSRAADAVELFVTEGIMSVMNRFNRKEDRE